MTTDPALANPDAMKELALNLTSPEAQRHYVRDYAVALRPEQSQPRRGHPSQAAELWKAIATDQQWPPPPTNGADGKPFDGRPNSITVNYQNVSGVKGAALKASQLWAREL